MIHIDPRVEHFKSDSLNQNNEAKIVLDKMLFQLTKSILKNHYLNVNWKKNMKNMFYFS